MKATRHVHTTYTIEMSEEEAQYLRALTQNYMGTVRGSESSPERELRHAIYNGLNAALIPTTNKE